MRKTLFGLLFVSTLISCGCGGSTTPDTPVVGEPAGQGGASNVANSPGPSQAPDTRQDSIALSPLPPPLPEVDPRIVAALPDLPAPEAIDQPIRLVYKPKAGEVWRYAVETRIQQDVMGMDSTQLAQIEIAYRINSVSDNAFQVTSKNTRTVYELRTPGGDFVINTVNPEQNKAAGPFRAMQRIWESILDCEVTYEVELSGHMPGFQLPTEIGEAVERHDPSGSSGLTANSFGANYYAGIAQLPKRPVMPGDSWSYEMPTAMLETVRSQQDATFLGVANMEGREVAMLQLTGQTSEPKERGLIQEFESDSVSIVLFDIEAGWVLRSHGITKVDSVVQVRDMDLEQQSEIIGTIRRIGAPTTR